MMQDRNKILKDKVDGWKFRKIMSSLSMMPRAKIGNIEVEFDKRTDIVKLTAVASVMYFPHVMSRVVRSIFTVFEVTPWSPEALRRVSHTANHMAPIMMEVMEISDLSDGKERPRNRVSTIETNIGLPVRKINNVSTLPSDKERMVKLIPSTKMTEYIAYKNTVDLATRSRVTRPMHQAIPMIIVLAATCRKVTMQGAGSDFMHALLNKIIVDEATE